MLSRFSGGLKLFVFFYKSCGFAGFREIDYICKNQKSTAMKRLLFLVGACCCMNAHAQLTTDARQVLFATYPEDTIPHRIPALSVTPGGQMLAITDYRYCKRDIGFGRVDLHGRISNDNGKTWEPIFPVIEGTGVHNAVDCGFGDAAVVADRETGELLLACVSGEHVYFAETTNRSNPQPCAMMRSKDGGKTWTPFVNQAEQIYSLFDHSTLGPIQAMFVGSGKICQSSRIKVGSHYRLYAAICARPGGNRVIYSDDFGDTWHALGNVDISPAPDGDEPKCEELPDGSVLLSSRANGGRIFNIFTYSNIGTAQGEWGKSAHSDATNKGTVALENACNGEILILPVERKADNKPMYLALQSVPLGPDRTNVGIYYKALDEADYRSPERFAANWEGRVQISNMSSAYSTMVPQTDGRIGVFFEELTYGAGYSMVYDAYTMEQLTENKYKWVP